MKLYRRNILESTFFSEEWKKLRNNKVITPECYDYNPIIIEDNSILKEEIDPVIGNIKTERYNYSRFGSSLEKKLAEMILQLEVGYVEDYKENFNVLFFPSGMAAISNIINIIKLITPNELSKTNKFIVDKNIYSATKYFFKEMVPNMGFGNTLFVDMKDETTFSEILAINNNKIVAVFYEPVSNPSLKYIDTRKIREILSYYSIPIIVDNTLLTSDLQQQFRLGADLIINSMTKYWSGKSDLTAGAVIGPKIFINGCRNMQGIIGNTLDLAAMSKLCERLPGLHNRMRQHSSNAAELAGYLRSCDYVKKVIYPSIDFTRYNSAGGLVSFIMDRKKQEKLIEACIKNYHKPLAVQVGFGSQNYRIVPNIYGSSDLEEGFTRLATGLTPDVKEVIKFIDLNIK